MLVKTGIQFFFKKLDSRFRGNDRGDHENDKTEFIENYSLNKQTLILSKN